MHLMYTYVELNSNIYLQYVFFFLYYYYNIKHNFWIFTSEKKTPTFIY